MAELGFSVFSVLSGHVAELVYAYDSESYPARVGSSSLPMPTQDRTAHESESYSVRNVNVDSTII